MKKLGNKNRLEENDTNSRRLKDRREKTGRNISEVEVVLVREEGQEVPLYQTLK